MARAYDILIVGAGVIGSSIAFHLARAGAGRVAVVERGAVCSGNTAKSGALVRMHYSNEPEARMALASLPYFRNWSDLVGGDCGFRQTGFALLVSPENVERLHRNVARLRALGVNTRALTPDELREVQPSMDAEGVGAAAYEPESGYADPVATTRALMDRACELGAELYVDTPVTAIRTEHGRVTGVDTARGELAAPVVVCAANTWSPALLQSAGVDLTLWARRGQVAFFDRPARASGEQIVLIDTPLGLYSRPDRDGTLLAGVSAAAGGEPEDPDRFDERLDPDYPDRVRAQLGRRLPTLAKATFARGHAGMYDMSPDTRAILDGAPGVAGLYLAAGFSGTGFKKAPAVGACMAELILNGQATTVDLTPFRYTRFAEDAPIHGEDEYTLPTDWGHGF